MEHNILTLDYWKDQVCYEGTLLPSGTLGCDALNLPEDLLQSLTVFSLPLNQVLLSLTLGQPEQTQLAAAGTAILQMLPLLRKTPPFSYFLQQGYEDWLQEALSDSFFQDVQDYVKAVSETGVAAALDLRYKHGIAFLKLVQVFAQLPSTISMYQSAMVPFAEALQTCSRTPEAYAAVFDRYFASDLTLSADDPSWMSLTNISVQYLSSLLPGKEVPQLVKRMHYVSFFGMLRSDLFEGLCVGHAPRKCPICGRWFLTLDARHTKYCGGLAPNDPKHRTCRQIGNLKGRQQRELADDHPLKVIYERRLNTILQSVRRGSLPQDLADKMRKLAKDKLERAISDHNYAKAAYPQEMEQAALRREALASL